MPDLKKEIDIFIDDLQLLEEEYPDDFKDINDIINGTKTRTSFENDEDKWRQTGLI